MSNQSVAVTPEMGGWYCAPAAGAAAPGVVVLMEAFGLTDHVRRVCERLAAAGYAALAPDLYRGKVFAYDRMQDVIATLSALKDDAAMADVGASLDWLAGRPEVNAAQLTIVGFCMGGRLAFLAGCRHPRLRATVSFYGGSIFPEGDKDRLGRSPPIGEAAALTAPLLLIYGGQDASIAPAERARLAQRLGELDKRHAISVYPGAGHGFCCEDREAYAPQAAETAFGETFDFLRRAFVA
jgi:carboxymethylenebutenolidase